MIQINNELLADLHQKAVENERLRMNLDMRTSPADTSQRMLNALEPGTKVPIHQHLNTAETVICLEGKIEEVFYEQTVSAVEMGDSRCTDIARKVEFKEIARVTLCPREGKYGVQVPQGVFHTVEVLEPSVIFEAKDGKYGEDGSRTYITSSAKSVKS